MRAVDTNILVRYLMNDDDAQAKRARRFVDESDVFVPPTVILETEWVLRRVFRATRAQICGAIRQFIGLPTVTVGAADLVATALDWHEHGMDFTDALHLAAGQHCDGIATFDRDFIRAAARLGIAGVAEP